MGPIVHRQRRRQSDAAQFPAMERRRRAWRLLAYGWAAPWSALGLVLAWMAVATGGWWRVRAGALECGGGCIGRLVGRLPPPLSFTAMTLGHVILGVDGVVLDASRSHEQVHVRQYERWGPLFVPAYLLSSAYQWLVGRHPYLDNRFEREASGSDGATDPPAARRRPPGAR
jgi:hypothetical protein